MLILSLLEARPRHGYGIGKLIEARSGGRLTFALPRSTRRSSASKTGGGSRAAGSRSRASGGDASTGSPRRGAAKLVEQLETWEAFIDTVKAVMGPSRA